jgi:hypothetical protein
VEAITDASNIASRKEIVIFENQRFTAKYMKVPVNNAVSKTLGGLKPHTRQPAETIYQSVYSVAHKS